MLRLNVIRVGFLMGVSLLVAAIIYSFAANWSGLGRAYKILASEGVVILFYGVSYLFSKMKSMLDHSSFLSSIFLVSGCISFGAAVAMINQIYNTQADSYELFLVWSIPALLFSAITRNNAFYILAYTLIHLTLWQYFFPSSLYISYTEEQTLLIGGLFALINLTLFILTETQLLRAVPLKAISFIIFHASLMGLTIYFHDNRFYDIGATLLCAAVIVIGFYYFIRVRLNKTMLTLNALAASAFTVIRFIELLAERASITLFISGLIFVALLLTGNVLFFRYLNKLGHSSSAADEDATATQHDEKRSVVVGRIVSTIVTVIGVMIGSISVIGLVFLASNGLEPQYTLYVLALLLVIPVLLIRRMNPAVRYTVLTIGYAAGMISIAWMDNIVFSVIFLLLSVAGWLRLEGRMQHLFSYSLININTSIILFQLLEAVSHAETITVIILTALNAIAYASHFLVREGKIRKYIRECGLLFSILFLFWLTFMPEIFMHSQVWFNLINFIVITIFVFIFVRRNQALEAGVSFFFWFAYVAFQYYDLFWTLLHKSITLALLGIVFLAVTYGYAYRVRASVPDKEQMKHHHMRGNWGLIAIVILLQLGYIGYHAVVGEKLLAQSATVKMHIEPLDSRSFLQGDNVTRNTSISEYADVFAKELEASLE